MKALVRLIHAQDPLAALAAHHFEIDLNGDHFLLNASAVQYRARRVDHHGKAVADREQPIDVKILLWDIAADPCAIARSAGRSTKLVVKADFAGVSPCLDDAKDRC
ncbi:hypothetical protein [Roseovarius sp. Pro17]|uniref:hypothetical protein n=1 Tax=Roseovarius sp. Pro17 TaxID=3108175 RepID=UPI002D790170|nr:hypothetical protein [Roseovarius sp. Pro17]